MLKSGSAVRRPEETFRPKELTVDPEMVEWALESAPGRLWERFHFFILAFRLCMMMRAYSSVEGSVSGTIEVLLFILRPERDRRRSMSSHS